MCKYGYFSKDYFMFMLFLFSLHLKASFPLHIRNAHNARYNFPELIKANPSLSRLVFVSEKSNDFTVNWSDQNSVYEFNKALLMHYYDISSEYTLPRDCLIPPVPSRVDYVHHVGDLVCASKDSKFIGLDIGCGANLIYPLLAVAEYPNFTMVGSDVCKTSLQIAANNAKSSLHSTRISLRLQSSPNKILTNIIQSDDFFDFVMCNPPFFASLKAASVASERKQKKLRTSGRNFQGSDRELCFPGGELAFIRQMIRESFLFRANLGWTTTLVSDKKNLEILLDDLRGGNIFPASEIPKTVKIVPISTGNKETRILAWKF